MGMLADKDYRAVIDIISPFAAGFVCLTPDSPRALAAEDLATELRNRGFRAQPCQSAPEGIEAAFRMAEGTDGIVCIVTLSPVKRSSGRKPCGEDVL